MDFVRSADLNAGNLSLEYNECSICFEHLYKYPIACLLKRQSARACRHYFHEDCISEWTHRNKTCPIDRVDYDSWKSIPSILNDPVEWFSVVDIDQSGSLSREAVLQILEAQLPLDCKTLRSNSDQLWSTWDPNGDGKLSFEEITDKERGLIKYVMEKYPKPEGSEEVPSLQQNLKAWFLHWDEDHNGRLSQKEVTRALVQTFVQTCTDSAQSLATIRQLQNSVQEVWCVFDLDGNGSIDVDEFCLPDGLGESFCCTLNLFHGLKSAQDQRVLSNDEDFDEMELSDYDAVEHVSR